MPHSIAIIGAGYVGATIAYAVMLRKIPADVLLVDINANAAEGQCLDLGDAEFTTPATVRRGTFQEAGACDVIVVTAGAKQQPGETRDQLVARNEHILKDILRDLQPLNQHAILLIVANPVEVLTHIAAKLSGLPESQVLGSGTFLDTMRLRKHLGDHFKVNDNALHCYVLGEHGDRQFIAWSSARCGPSRLTSLPEYHSLDRAAVHASVRHKAYRIIDLKGATYFGIGACVASLCESILYDRCDVRCVSVRVPWLNTVASWPVVVGRKGVQQLLDVELDEHETQALEVAVKAIQETCSKCFQED